MTFPTFDPQTGLKMNAAGTDIAPLWPKDGAGWTAAVVKARLWLIKGQWRYDLREGIDLLGQVLGQVPDLRAVQELFRAEISRDVVLTELRLRESEKGELFLEWKGAGHEESGTISLLEPPIASPVTLVSDVLKGSVWLFKFTEELYPQAVPTADEFELTQGTTFVSAIVRGDQLALTLAGVADDTIGIRYLPGPSPMRGISQVLVSPFALGAPTAVGADRLITDAGEFLVTDVGEYLIV